MKVTLLIKLCVEFRSSIAFPNLVLNLPVFRKARNEDIAKEFIIHMPGLAIFGVLLILSNRMGKVIEKLI